MKTATCTNLLNQQLEEGGGGGVGDVQVVGEGLSECHRHWHSPLLHPVHPGCLGLSPRLQEDGLIKITGQAQSLQ